MENETENLPIHENFEEFVKLNPPARLQAEAKEYFSTAEIRIMCNDIALDPYLNEVILLKLLKAHGYEMINLGPGVNKWMLK